MTIEDAITIFLVALSALVDTKDFDVGVTIFITPINIIKSRFYNKWLGFLMKFVEYGYYEYKSYYSYESSHAI